MRRATLEELEAGEGFESRHIGPTPEHVAQMLEAVGLDTLDALVGETVPDAIRDDTPLALPPPLTEPQARARLEALASMNRPLKSMIGLGYYGTHTPGVIARNLFENPGWYTAYTPYQAEVSQGRLEALLNYQQMVADLTGMDLANASLLDEATAAAEAMAMCRRVAKSKSKRLFVDADCHPQTLDVLRTRAVPLGVELVVGDAASDLDPAAVFGALVQYPASSGAVRDHRGVADALHAAGAMLIVASDLLALCLLVPPGEWGADVVVGNAQRFGVPLGYGGPHAAFFATRDAHKRAMPGRVIGVSVDAAGRPALRMALQTREQHIRREKATSNICTAQVLLANMAGFYAVYHGADGIGRIAERTHRLCAALAAGLRGSGFPPDNHSFFDTLTVDAPGQARAIVSRAHASGINLRAMSDDGFSVACDETTTREDVLAVLAAVSGDASTVDVVALDAAAEGHEAIPGALRRTSAYLQHPVFSAHRSETEMLRYLRRLQARDIALDRAMIPLGSCTMKLNATAEMEPVSLPGFSSLHPFAPLDQAQGYAQLFSDLERWLCAITGFDAVSLQPNAGSQGEYAGLLCIRRYHESRGEAHRDVCLIPSSAHGTNPASAVMAGMRVVVVKCDDQGNVDVSDLEAKAQAHADALAALMVTYPSTHGVFEEDIKQICATIHGHGGQVYMDGANLNALIGVCRPAALGADVSHMNLHKTFCIPHGGGGPGMGPIGVKSQLAPFLPGHVVVPLSSSRSGPRDETGAVSAAPWGSASILPISWAYLAMMGPGGLRRATEVSILSANYIAARLEPHFPVLYKGRRGRVAHECIVDLRPIKASCGISVDDVAKRLIDYGFHAPTMSWPVADTLMIEPTESEPKQELDRFCDAMIAIRAEIAAVESGEADPENNVLKHAPHTADLLTSEWDRPYDRKRAFFPSRSTREDKYWPPVGRVDNVYGDRHLVCSCPPLEAYDEAAE